MPKKINIKFSIDYSLQNSNRITSCFEHYITSDGEPIEVNCIMTSERIDAQIVKNEKEKIEDNPNYFFLVSFPESVVSNKAEKLKLQLCNTFQIKNPNQVIIISHQHKPDITGMSNDFETILTSNYQLLISTVLGQNQLQNAQQQLAQQQLAQQQRREENPSHLSNISMMVLGGFINAAGIAAVAIAFIVLNAATFGVAGLVVGAVGTAAVLSGIGLFATGAYKNRQGSVDDVPYSGHEMASST